MKLSGELDYRIRYDVEHDLFHAQNVFNDEYIQPTFIEYVQNLEKENAELKADNDARKFAMAMSEKVEKQLREENTELKHQLAHRNCIDCSNHSSNLRMRNLELEKENAELKKLKRECETSLCRAEYQYNYEQLTKAKEIIKQLLLLPYANNEEVFADVTSILDKAEQFLSEVEK